MMNVNSPLEEVLNFECEQSLLWGILTRPPAGITPSPVAALIVVGGPQYRIGSHRQFVLLARALARQGHPTLRFDYRGMGDSEGGSRTFEDTGPDLQAALDALCTASDSRYVVVWGLCDAASAAMMHATAHDRVAGIVAANPWARSDASLAATHVKHYYGPRLLQREFWSKLMSGRFDWRGSFDSLLANLRRSRLHAAAIEAQPTSFQSRMARGLASFRGRVLLLLSGNDLTAKEFLQYTDSAVEWRGLLSDPKVSRVDIPEADHTFSRRVWLGRVEEETIAWMRGFGRMDCAVGVEASEPA